MKKKANIKKEKVKVKTEFEKFEQSKIKLKVIFFILFLLAGFFVSSLPGFTEPAGVVVVAAPIGVEELL